MLNALRGIRTPAWLVGFLRGLAESIVYLAIYSFIDFVNAGGLPDQYKILGMVAILGLRSLEGTVDQIDPLKARRRQAADEVTP